VANVNVNTSTSTNTNTNTNRSCSSSRTINKFCLITGYYAHVFSSWCVLGIGVVSSNVSVCVFFFWVVLCNMYRAAPPTNYIYTGRLFTVGWLDGFGPPKSASKS